MDVESSFFFLRYAKYLAEIDMNNKKDTNAEAIASILQEINV